jgi:hypothetical protein
VDGGGGGSGGGGVGLGELLTLNILLFFNVWLVKVTMRWKRYC